MGYTLRSAMDHLLALSIFILVAMNSIASAQDSAATIAKARVTCQTSYSADHITALTAVIAKEPNNDAAYAARSLCGAVRNVKEYARADFEKALSINPKNVLALTVRAFYKSVTGDENGALADYDQALSIDAKDELANFFRDRLLRENPKLIDPAIIDAKLYDLKKEAEASNQDYEVYLKLNDYFRTVKRYEERSRYFLTLSSVDPANVCAFYFAAQGSPYNEKKELFDRAIHSFDGTRGRRCSAEAAFWAGRHYEEPSAGRTRNEREAYRYFRLALYRDPSIPHVKAWIAKLNPEIVAEGDSNSVADEQERIQKVNLRYAEDLRRIQASTVKYNAYAKERASIYDTTPQRRSELLGLMKKEMLLHIDITQKALSELGGQFNSTQKAYYERILAAAKSKLNSLPLQ